MCIMNMLYNKSYYFTESTSRTGEVLLAFEFTKQGILLLSFEPYNG